MRVDPSKLKYQNVTISGLPGAGSTTLAKRVADLLGWQQFSGGDFMRAYAVEKGLFDPQTGFHHDATVYDEAFDREVDFGMRKKVSEKTGNVLDAWLAGFMTLGVPGVLKVLVYCSDDAIRVDRIVNRDRVGIDGAKMHIFERESKNRQKWTRMYKSEWEEWAVKPGSATPDDPIDFWDQRLYDLVIDTYSNSREETLKRVLDYLGYRQGM